ncbi:hypothetical protein Q8A73_010497 [Channa argus]|nr:hypothetical protein Q8A73_010497 [Channa argus]
MSLSVYMRVYVCVSSRVCVNLRGSSFFRHSGVLPAARYHLQRRPGAAEPALLFCLQGASAPSNLQSLTPPPPLCRHHCYTSSTPTPPPLKTTATTTTNKQIRDPSMPQQQLGIRLSSPKVTAGAAAGFPRPREHGDSTEMSDCNASPADRVIKCRHAKSCTASGSYLCANISASKLLCDTLCCMGSFHALRS